MTTILGYARVSTGDQDVAGQTMRLEQAGAIKIFTDVMSGKSMDRPGLAELLAYARQGDTLAIVRLDRLGRSLAELLSTVEDLRKRGIALLSLEEKIDTSSAAGELIFHVFGAIAHFERRLISGNCSGSLFPWQSSGDHLIRPGCVGQTGRGIGAPARVRRMASMARTDRRRPVSTAERTSA